MGDIGHRWRNPSRLSAYPADSMTLQPLEPGPTQGLWQIGQHILTSGDLIEFADAGEIVPGRIEHDGMRYIVVAGSRWLPLAEILTARYMGSGRP